MPCCLTLLVVQMADIWSSGVMLYTMLVGRFPFQRPEDTQLGKEQQRLREFERIQRVDYVIPEGLGISHQCRDLLTSMLRREPSQRITIADICAHPWFITGLPENPPAISTNNQYIEAALHPEHQDKVRSWTEALRNQLQLAQDNDRHYEDYEEAPLPFEEAVDLAIEDEMAEYQNARED